MFKTKYNQSTLIILFLVLLFILSSAYLFYANNKFLDLNSGKNFWVLSFQNPKSDSLDFSIENHSANTNFHWQILDGESTIEENDILVNAGETKNIKPQDVKIFENKKIIIRITSGDEKKEIYKNF